MGAKAFGSISPEGIRVRELGQSIGFRLQEPPAKKCSRLELGFQYLLHPSHLQLSPFGSHIERQHAVSENRSGPGKFHRHDVISHPLIPGLRPLVGVFCARELKRHIVRQIVPLVCNPLRNGHPDCTWIKIAKISCRANGSVKAQLGSFIFRMRSRRIEQGTFQFVFCPHRLARSMQVYKPLMANAKSCDILLTSRDFPLTSRLNMGFCLAR